MIKGLALALSIILSAETSSADQLKLDLAPNITDAYPGIGTFSAPGTLTSPAVGKIDVDGLAKLLVERGGATDVNALAKSLEGVFSRPAFSPDGLPTYSPGYVPTIPIIPIIPSGRGTGVPLFPPSPQLAVSSGNIGVMNPTRFAFGFLVARSNGSVKKVELSAGELRTFECETDCAHGFKIRYTSGSGANIKEIELSDKTIYVVTQDGLEWTIKPSTPGEWRITASH